MNHRFEPHARQELRDAVAYYDRVSLTLGNEFLKEVTRMISLILKFPEAWPELSPSTRKARTRRFPYGILYRVKEEQVEIIAVMHLSREPNYWVDRDR